jgi:hypothetical protein
MAEDIINVDLNKFNLFFLNKEKEILNKYTPENDGGTGLGNNSITSRYSNYNLLNFPEMFFLKNIIKDKHEKFLKELNLDIKEPYYILCWFNVLRKGESIKKHYHSKLEEGYCFLSGHICVDTKDSSTYYEPPFFNGCIEIKNQNNQIVFFPSWLNHYTSKVDKEYNRITIAFDIIYHQYRPTFDPKNESKKWIKLNG